MRKLRGKSLALAIGSAIVMLCLGSIPIVTAATKPPGHPRHMPFAARTMSPSSTRASVTIASATGLAVPAGVGTNVAVASASTTTAATLDPTAHANLFVGGNLLGPPPMGAFRSADGGATWATSTPPLPPTAPNAFAALPGPAFEATGGLLYSYLGIATTTTTISTQLVVSKSTDKGATWSTPVTVESQANGPDKPLMAVDLSPSAFHGRRYVAYDTNPPAFSQPLVVARSDDSTSWLKTQVWDSGGDIGAFPAIGPNGELYVAWNDYCGGIQSPTGPCKFPASGYSSLLIAKSTDGGLTFTALGQTPVTVSNTSIGFSTSIPNYSNTKCSATPFQIITLPGLAVDNSNGPYRGSLYLVWADQRSGMHVFLSSSHDGGAHWSLPTQLDVGNPRESWEPAVAVDPSNGNLFVTWYDRRDDPADKLYRIYATESFDGGSTFMSTPVPISTAASDPTLSCTGTGDFTEMVATDGVAHPVWSDTRNGTNQIFAASIDEAAIAAVPPTPARLAAVTDYPAGGAVASPIIADFNGDGKPDVAVANGTGIAVLLGRGEGTLGPPISNPIGYGVPMQVATADFNGDGKPDLAVINGYAKTVTVLLGNGDGTFRQSAQVTFGSTPFAVTTGDFNGDHKADIVVGLTTGTIETLLGNGDGTFKPPVATPAPNLTGQNIVAADFNGDGKLDLAIGLSGPYPSGLGVMLGNGDGTLAAPVGFAISDVRQQDIVVGDFNGDGKPDIAVSSLAYPTGVSVLIDTSTGGTLSFRAAANYGPGNPPGLAVADMNGDGRPDLVVISGATITVLAGVGDGTFQFAGRSNAGAGPTSLAIGDVNGDGHPDVVAPGSNGSVAVMLGRGDGTLLTGTNYAVGFSPQSVVTGDFTGHGKTDLAVESGDGISVFPGNGDGTFGTAIVTPLSGAGRLTAADLRGNGKLDLVVADSSPNAISVLLGNGNGTFAAPTVYPLTTAAGGVAIADFNGDGRPDIAVSGSVFSGTTQVGVVQIFIGNGDGTFKSPQNFNVGSIAAGPIVAGDFNGDGKPDLAVSIGGATVGPNTVAVFLNTSTGGALSFAAPIDVGITSAVLATGDFNRDGKLDIVAGSSNGLFIYLGNGDGTFKISGPYWTQSPDARVTQFAVGDINGDGNADLVIAASGTSLPILLGGGANWMLGGPTYYETGQGPSSVAVGDFDADGNLDVAVTNANDNNVTVLLGVAPKVTAIPTSLSFGDEQVGLTTVGQTVSLTNTGPNNVHVTGASITGLQQQDFVKSSDTCTGSALLSGKSCSVMLAFAPTAVGARSATLQFVDDGQGGSQSVPLTGNGTPPAPGSPTNLTALAGDREVALTWTPPSFTGGSSLKTYSVTTSPGGAILTVSSVVPAATITGLTNGTPYTFTVSTTNAAGTSGTLSAASASVTPTAVPQNTSVAVLPAMSDQAYGGYLTTAYLQNTGSSPAHIRVQYFDTSGNAVGFGNSVAGLPVGGSWTLRTDNGDALPNGQPGSAIVYSDQSVAVFVNEFAPNNNSDATSYTSINVATGTGSTIYAPAIANNAYGGYTTGIGLINLATTLANITVTYRDNSGTAIKTQTLNSVPAGAYQGLYSGDVTLGLPNQFAGTATITSSAGNLAAIVNETGPGGQFSSYDSVPAGSTTLYAPAALSNAYGGYNTGMGIQNTTSTAGTVTITYYDLNGSPRVKSFPIVANGYLGVYQGTDIPLDGAYTAKLSSTVAIAAIVNEVAPSPTSAKQSTAYNTFVAGSSSLHLPLVESAGADGWSTGEGIMNTGTSATTATVTYYDTATGLQVGTAQSLALQPNAFWGLYQPAGGLPNGMRASAIVTTAAGGQVAVICNESNATTFMSYGGI